MAQETVKKSDLNGICRKQTVSVKNKTKMTGFCDNCKHIAEMTNEKTCMCCGFKVTHKQNHDALMRRFEEIIKDNQGFLDGFMRYPSKAENRFYAWVKDGLWHYKIDMRFFVEYMDIAFNEGEDKYDMFFDYIKRICPRIIV